MKLQGKSEYRAVKEKQQVSLVKEYQMKEYKLKDKVNEQSAWKTNNKGVKIAKDQSIRQHNLINRDRL